jgi:hypothetical protein
MVQNAMTAYRRNLAPGGAYFFTLNLANRRLSLLFENIGLLRMAFRYTRHRRPFTDRRDHYIAGPPSYVVDIAS